MAPRKAAKKLAPEPPTIPDPPILESEESSDEDLEINEDDIEEKDNEEEDNEEEDSEDEGPSASSTHVARKRVTITKKAGLTFPVAKAVRQLKNDRYADRISKTAGVYMAATLEYLTAEVIEGAGEAAKQNKRQRITPRHVKLAVAHDSELKELLKDVTIAGGGVMPHIETLLLPKTTQNKKDNEGDSSKAKPLAKSKSKVARVQASNAPETESEDQELPAEPEPKKAAPKAKKVAPKRKQSEAESVDLDLPTEPSEPKKAAPKAKKVAPKRKQAKAQSEDPNEPGPSKRVKQAPKTTKVPNRKVVYSDSDSD